jgi:hypothetical protein
MSSPEPIPVDVINALPAAEPEAAEFAVVVVVGLVVVEETAELIAISVPSQLALMSARRFKT